MMDKEDKPTPEDIILAGTSYQGPLDKARKLLKATPAGFRDLPAEAVTEEPEPEPEPDRLKIPADWSFDAPTIADNFDGHVREQLPWYDLASAAVVEVVRAYLPAGGRVYDIGASTGNMARRLERTIIARKAELIAIEPSAEMVACYGGPFADRLVLDRAERFDYKTFDVAVMFLSLMFVEPDYREDLLAHLVGKMNRGGAIIVLDKMLPPAGYEANVLRLITLGAKLDAGVGADEVLRKERSLSGIQRPFAWDLLGDAAVEFFRFGDFAGWIIPG